MEKITICIPFYNDKRFLKDSISSVINQTFKNWKLILLDDGSTDGSLKIAKSYLYDKRIELISDGINRGLIYRLNQSIKMTETKYYARMDADDIMHPERIERQIKILRENQNIDVLGTAAYSIDNKNSIRGLRGNYDKKISPCKAFIHPTVMGKTSWFKENTYSPVAERMEDSELWYRTGNKSNFYIVNKPLLFYREQGNNYYKKYFKTLPSCLKLSAIYFNYNSTKSGFKWIKNFFYQFIKGSLFWLFNLFKKEDYLIRKRFTRLSNTERKKASFILLQSTSWNEK